MPKAIAIIYNEKNIHSVPCLMALMEAYCKKGYHIDVYSRYSKWSENLLQWDNNQITWLNNWRQWKALRKPLRWIPSHLYAAWVFKRRSIKMNYECVFIVDPWSAYDALVLTYFNAALCKVYYSLEIIVLRSTPHHAVRRMKTLARHEKLILNKSSYAIIQDDQRARLFAEQTGYPMNLIVTIPNAPLLCACNEKTSVLREMFRVNDKRIALYAGSVTKNYGCIQEIIDSVSSWPNNWVLVINSRAGVDQARIHELTKKNKHENRVFFVNAPFEYAEYEKLVRSSDVGLAFYQENPESSLSTENTIELGLSSGKSAYYLRSGVPVITNDYTTFGRFVRETQCGLTVNDFVSIGGSLQVIDQKYDKFSAAASNAYKRYWDPREKIDDLIKSLQNGS